MRALALAAGLAIAVPAARAATPVPPLTGPVVDQAGLLGADDVRRLEALARAARSGEGGTGVQLQYLIVPSLQGALGRLLAVAESYPQLKANENFRDLQTQLEGTENRIAIARRRYIEAVNAFNDLVTVPPTSWTNALAWHKQPKPQFAATTAGAAEAPKVKFQ